MLVRTYPIILSLLVFMVFTLCPTLSLADDDFLVKFGEAYAQAANEDGEGEESDDNEKPVLPVASTETINRHRVLRQVLRTAKQFAETFGLVAAMAAVAIFLFLTHLLFICYTIVVSTHKREKLEDVALLMEERPWKTLGLGILNALLAIVVISILFNPPLKLFGFLFLSWFFAQLLDGFSAKALQLGNKLYSGDYENLPVRPTVGALVLWPLYLIPVYGQVSFILTMYRGLGAKVWLRFRPRHTPETTEVITIDDDEEKASADTVIK